MTISATSFKHKLMRFQILPLLKTLQCPSTASEQIQLLHMVCDTLRNLAPTYLSSHVPLDHEAPITLVFLLNPDHNKLLPVSVPLHSLLLSAFTAICPGSSMGIFHSSFRPQLESHPPRETPPPALTNGA